MPVVDRRRFLQSSTVLAGGVCFGRLASASRWSEPISVSALAAEFAKPSTEYGPQIWWHWVDGNISREGITADLESMQRVGIRAALLVMVTQSVPQGPVRTLSPEWYELVKFAMGEAARLGMEFGVENCAGWTSSGGPWVTPDESMQFVTFSEMHVSGPKRFAEKLPTPPMRHEFYRDVAVVAFPRPAVEDKTLRELKVVVSASSSGFEIGKSGARALQLQGPEKNAWVQFEAAEPFTARTLSLSLTTGKASFRVEASDDGHRLRPVVSGVYGQPAEGMTQNFYALPETTARVFRVTFLETKDAEGRVVVSDLDLLGAPRVHDFRSKADYVRGDGKSLGGRSLEVAMVGHAAQTVDLSAHLKEDGRLEWEVPAGEWTILRAGRTTTGIPNHPAPVEARGLECDKLSRAAVKSHWDAMMAKIVAEAGPLAGKTLRHTWIDSWEVGSENWTPGMEKLFAERCGYSLLPFLPALAGRVVNSEEETERFLWDFRRTVAVLFAENYVGYMTQLAHQAGLTLAVEPYGDGPFDEILTGAESDVPMSEFWVPNKPGAGIKLASSIANVHGRPLAGAEAFTGTTQNSRWQQSPRSLKPVGDAAFAYGINQLAFHRFAHQPWMNRAPGVTMGQWGTNFDRTNTWWEQSKDWITYLTRCQYLLRQGRSVSDVLLMAQEGSPSKFRTTELKGFDYDVCSAEDMVRLLRVERGELVFPSGVRYRVLALPAEVTRMTPELLRKLKEIVEAGACVVGPMPKASPSLREYPRCDAEVKQLAAELWGSGRIRDVSLQQVLEGIGVQPDFHCEEKAAELMYLHRSLSVAELYFVSNQSPEAFVGDVFFRVKGVVPELWNPMKGSAQAATVFALEEKRTRVTLQLEGEESVFVMFRRGTAGAHLVAVRREQNVEAESSLVIRKAVFAAMDGTSTGDVTAKVAAQVQGGVLRLPISPQVLGDPAPMHRKQLTVEYTLEGIEGTQTLPEGRTMLLKAARGARSEISAKVRHGSSGELELVTCESGGYVLTSAAGRETTMHVPTLPVALDLSTDWDVVFQPGRGALGRVKLEKLASLHTHPDSGVRYFSGTATYSRRFTMPEGFAARGGLVELDLGGVEVVAEVKVNGLAVPTLWTSPYSADITALLRPGENSLEIAVTNLWVNRLIGDEQLPEDAEWVHHPWAYGYGLKEWPAWVLQGKPSPTGRIAFATWKAWGKDDPLLAAGLVGPVWLRRWAVMPVKVS